MWGGNLLFPIAANMILISNLVAFGRGNNGTFEDPNAALILSFAFNASGGTWLAISVLEHAVPQGKCPRPTAFDSLLHVPGLLADTTANKFMSEVTLDFDTASPKGYRETSWELLFLLDESILSALLEIWYEESEVLTRTLGSEVQVPALDLQVITEPQLERMSRDGGNALGMADDSSGPLAMAHWTCVWDDASKDSVVFEAYRPVLDRVKATGEELGVNHRVIYLNYVSHFQDPVSGYGPESKARLLVVSKKCDPHGVFQTLQPAYFKLDKGPLESISC